MNKLYKPSGKEVNVSDSSLKHALSIGWTVKNPIKKARKPAPKAD